MICFITKIKIKRQIYYLKLADLFYNTMENHTDQLIDAAAIKILHNIRNKYNQHNAGLDQKCILIQEKIIYASIIFLNNASENDDKRQMKIPEIGKLIIQFVQKINKLVMENYETNENEQLAKLHEKFLNKSISLLMLSEISKFVQDGTLLKKLKILSFNNLSCLYKKKKKFGVAMRAINFAVQLEEQLLKNQANQQKYDIIPTYLNKAAIYSEMKKHHEALTIILKAKSHVEQIEKELILQIQKTSEENEKKRLLQKRYYGMYMKMIIFYNMAAEKEHLRLNVQALEFYKQSKQIAIIIDNQLMIVKLTSILQSLMQKKE